MSFGAFPIINNLYLENDWSQQNRWNLGLWDISNTYMGAFDLVVFKIILG